jgi:hypothetical protein
MMDGRKARSYRSCDSRCTVSPPSSTPSGADAAVGHLGWPVHEKGVASAAAARSLQYGPPTSKLLRGERRVGRGRKQGSCETVAFHSR